MTLPSLRRGYERFLEWICIVLMAALAAEVVAGVVFRYSGHSLVWYDEVATILLAWVTFYGAALAVLPPKMPYSCCKQTTSTLLMFRNSAACR